MDVVGFIGAAGIRPNKRMDQFFLTDNEILDKEVALLQLKPEDVVLEIGAGFGTLALRIAKKCRLLAVEQDPKLVQYLRKIGNTVAMQNDVLKVLKEARTDGRIGTFNKVIGNIPYSKSQDIILEILKHPWEVAVLCVQKEFADKLVKKDKLALLLEDCCSVKIAMNVGADKFHPEAVKSSIVVIRQKKQMDEELWKFLQRLYKDKNRNVSNVVKDSGKLGKRKINSLKLGEIKRLQKNQ